MNEVINYNELFSKLQKDCDAKNCCNAFKYITLDDLIDLNHLLDRVILFCLSNYWGRDEYNEWKEKIIRY